MVGGKEGRFRNQLVWQEVQFGGDTNKKEGSKYSGAGITGMSQCESQERGR